MLGGLLGLAPGLNRLGFHCKRIRVKMANSQVQAIVFRPHWVALALLDTGHNQSYLRRVRCSKANDDAMCAMAPSFFLAMVWGSTGACSVWQIAFQSTPLLHVSWPSAGCNVTCRAHSRPSPLFRPRTLSPGTLPLPLDSILAQTSLDHVSCRCSRYHVASPRAHHDVTCSSHIAVCT